MAAAPGRSSSAGARRRASHHNGGMDVNSSVKALSTRLREAGTPERAINEKRYLKSELEFWGVALPDIRRAVKAVVTGPVVHAELVTLIELLWREPIHELRMAAVEIATTHAAHLEPADVPLLERMLRESKTWAFVDALAVHAAGPVLARHPGEDSILDRWATDDDFWIRRSALLSHLGPLRQGAGNWDRFARYADAMLEEKEFFIRKAIGWILRDTARKRPDLVYQWIEPRADRASGVTIREAVKRLSPDQAARVDHRYRSGR